MIEVSYDTEKLKDEIYLLGERYDCICFFKAISDIEKNMFNALVDSFEEEIPFKEQKE
jgi:hypothetical protein